MKEVTIYTDGACSPNPGPGGWGAVLLYDRQAPRELSGYGGQTTNNRMELTAVIKALNALDGLHQVTLYTDSQYVKNGITSWIKKWQQNNWRTADKKEVKNAELWQELLAISQKHTIEWRWVRGHSLNRWNERADELAVLARKDGEVTIDQTKPAVAADDDAVHLYLGVTCKHKSGIGGWAVIMGWREHIKIMGSRVEGMTANQLYINAATEAITTLKKQCSVVVHTHSGYLCDGAGSWLAGWKKRNWQTREGNEVSNRKEWQKLSGLLDRFPVSFQLDQRDNPLCHLVEAKEIAREFEQEQHDG